MATGNTAIDIALRLKDQATRPMQRALGVVNRTLGSTLRMALNLKTAFAGLAASFGVGLLGKGLLDTASQFERFQLQLETIEGSSARARSSLDWITEFAATTPYEVAELTAAFVKLRAYGIDPTDGTLRTLGDTAAGMGKSLDQAVEALADASTGEFERLKEFGIKAKTTADQVQFAWTDALGNMRKTTASKQADIIRDTLTTIWNERYSGGMAKLSASWAGMWSNLKDRLTLFKKDVAESGPFQALKAGLAEVLAKIDQFAADGTLKQWAQDTARAIITGFRMMAEGVGEFLRAINLARGTWGELQLSYNQDRRERLGKTLTRFTPEAVGGPEYQATIAELVRLDQRIAGLNGNQDELTAQLRRIDGNFSALDARLQQIGAAGPPAAGGALAPSVTGTGPTAPSGTGAALHAKAQELKDFWQVQADDRYAVQGRALDAMVALEDTALERQNLIADAHWRDGTDMWLVQLKEREDAHRRSLDYQVEGEEAAARKREQAVRGTLGIIGQVTGDAAALYRQLYEDSGGQAQQYWEAYKALAVTQTLVAGIVASMEAFKTVTAFAGPVAGGAAASVVMGLATTNAALIASQQPAVAFAAGGVVNRPTYGVFGEAGTEAVIPLDKLPAMVGKINNHQGAGDVRIEINVPIQSAAVDENTVVLIRQVARQAVVSGLAEVAGSGSGRRMLRHAVAR